MDEYINKTKFEELMRKKARNNFDLYYADKSKRYHANAIGYTMAADEAHVFPAADVKPVKYSSWECRTYPIIDRDGVARRCMKGYVCKACGHGEPEEKRFCGGCGADMRGEQK